MDPVYESIVQARVNLLMRLPFFGNLATRLAIKESKGDWLKTAATNGREIHYNRAFFEKMTPAQIQFVICHEILHNVFEHLIRRDKRDHQLFNIACDYAVNGQLIRDKIGERPTDIKIFHDAKYDNMTAEEIYDELEKNAIKIDPNSLGELLDEHVDWNIPGEDGRPTLTKEEVKQIRDEVREAVINAAQTSGTGSVPANIARLITDFTEPKMNWRELLRQQIQSIIRSDFTFARPNRKGWHMNAILPGMVPLNQDSVSILAALDMSGSIDDLQARDFLSEIRGIMQEFPNFEIIVLCFDTQVYNVEKFDQYNIHEYDSYEPRGGGGTDFMCVWDYMKEHDIVPKKLVMFTDMYDSGDFGDHEYCDTIFINHGREGFVAPHGITVEYSA